MRLLNPLQWTFGPRTTATLLTWAIVPLLFGGVASWRSLVSSAGEAGLTAEQLDTLVRSMLQSLLIVTIPLLLVCLGAAVLFSWVVVQPLWRLRKAMEQVAEGNLAQEPLPVTSRDEVGQIAASFNTMTACLQTMVASVAHSTGDLDAAGRRLHHAAGESTTATESSACQVEQVRSIAVEQAGQAYSGARAADELRHAAEQVAVSASAQAREVEKVAQTVQQVAAAIEQVAGSAGVVSGAATKTRCAADDGGKAVAAVVSGMAQVQDRVLTAAGQVRALSDSLQQVDEILRLISEIADQTDLLALNAAIEAARVGEHGRGFAVVAGEVRRLAERSRRAAGDIGDRVEGLRQGARRVVETMEAGTQEVRSGTALAHEAGSSLERIQAAVVETQQQVEAISAAAEEIAAAGTDVVEATHQLSAIAEENAATAEEMLSGARTVADLVGVVERGARSAELSAVTMASAAAQMRGSVADTAVCASEVQATSARLREHVARFRIK